MNALDKNRGRSKNKVSLSMKQFSVLKKEVSRLLDRNNSLNDRERKLRAHRVVEELENVDPKCHEIIELLRVVRKHFFKRTHGSKVAFGSIFNDAHGSLPCDNDSLFSFGFRDSNPDEFRLPSSRLLTGGCYKMKCDLWVCSERTNACMGSYMNLLQEKYEGAAIRKTCWIPETTKKSACHISVSLKNGNFETERNDKIVGEFLRNTAHSFCCLKIDINDDNITTCHSFACFVIKKSVEQFDVFVVNPVRKDLDEEGLGYYKRFYEHIKYLFSADAQINNAILSSFSTFHSTINFGSIEIDDNFFISDSYSPLSVCFLIEFVYASVNTCVPTNLVSNEQIVSSFEEMLRRLLTKFTENFESIKNVLMNYGVGLISLFLRSNVPLQKNPTHRIFHANLVKRTDDTDKKNILYRYAIENDCLTTIVGIQRYYDIRSGFNRMKEFGLSVKSDQNDNGFRYYVPHRKHFQDGSSRVLMVNMYDENDSVELNFERGTLTYNDNGFAPKTDNVRDQTFVFLKPDYDIMPDFKNIKKQPNDEKELANVQRDKNTVFGRRLIGKQTAAKEEKEEEEEVQFMKAEKGLQTVDLAVNDSENIQPVSVPDKLLIDAVKKQIKTNKTEFDTLCKRFSVNADYIHNILMSRPGNQESKDIFNRIFSAEFSHVRKIFVPEEYIGNYVLNLFLFALQVGETYQVITADDLCPPHKDILFNFFKNRQSKIRFVIFPQTDRGHTVTHVIDIIDQKIFSHNSYLTSKEVTDNINTYAPFKRFDYELENYQQFSGSFNQKECECTLIPIKFINDLIKEINKGATTIEQVKKKFANKSGATVLTFKTKKETNSFRLKIGLILFLLLNTDDEQVFLNANRETVVLNHNRYRKIFLKLRNLKSFLVNDFEYFSNKLLGPEINDIARDRLFRVFFNTYTNCHNSLTSFFREIIYGDSNETLNIIQTLNDRYDTFKKSDSFKLLELLKLQNSNTTRVTDQRTTLQENNKDISELIALDFLFLCMKHELHESFMLEFRELINLKDASSTIIGFVSSKDNEEIRDLSGLPLDIEGIKHFLVKCKRELGEEVFENLNDTNSKQKEKSTEINSAVKSQNPSKHVIKQRFRMGYRQIITMFGDESKPQTCHTFFALLIRLLYETTTIDKTKQKELETKINGNIATHLNLFFHPDRYRKNDIGREQYLTKDETNRIAAMLGNCNPKNIQNNAPDLFAAEKSTLLTPSETGDESKNESRMTIMKKKKKININEEKQFHVSDFFRTQKDPILQRLYEANAKDPARKALIIRQKEPAVAIPEQSKPIVHTNKPILNTNKDTNIPLMPFLVEPNRINAPVPQERKVFGPPPPPEHGRNTKENDSSTKQKKVRGDQKEVSSTKDSKRLRKVLRDNIQGITKPAIKRVCRKGGIKRIGSAIYEETRGVLKVYLENVLKDCITFCEHSRRKTVSSTDVVHALKKRGTPMYGFGS